MKFFCAMAEHIPLVAITLPIQCTPHSPYHYPSFPFFFPPLFGHFSGLSICSFHLPRPSPGPLIYTAPTAPVGQTRLRRHSPAALKGHNVHTDMKRQRERQRMAFREITQRHEISEEKDKDTQKKGKHTRPSFSISCRHRQK